MKTKGFILSWSAVLLGVQSVLAQFTIGFDRARYDISPGETFAAHVSIVPVPGPGLSSYGVKLLFNAANASVTNLSAISVPTALNFNGVAGTGAVKAAGEGFAAAKGTVDFFTLPQQPYPGSLLLTFQITDRGTGPYLLRLAPFNTLGPTEEIFVDGACAVLDSQLSFGTALVNYRPTVRITSPTNGAVFIGPLTLPVTAEANDPDGGITNVSFYADANFIGAVNHTPWSINWVNAPLGTHSLTAVASDNFGATTTSSNVVITIRSNVPPMAQPYAIFGGASVSDDDEEIVDVEGRRHTVIGKIHSNGDLDLSGEQHLFRNGAVEYVTDIHLHHDFAEELTFDNSPIIRSTGLPYPVDYTLAEFAPGGASALAAQAVGKYFHITDEDDLDDYIVHRVLREGLYYGEGNVRLTADSLRGRVTIVATGEIAIEGDRNLFESYTRCLLFFAGKRGHDFNDSVLDVCGDAGKFQGVFFAPNGGVEIAGSGNYFSGSLIGLGVELTGSGHQVNAIDPTVCPPLIAPLAAVRKDRDLEILPTIPGLNYVIECTDSLSQPSWRPVATIVGDGRIQTLRLPNTVPQRFYRLRVD